MRDYLEDKKITKKYIHIDICFTVILILILCISIPLLILYYEEKLYTWLIISIILLILLVIVSIKYEKNIQKKYNEIFKTRNNYYVFDLKKEFSYEELVQMLDNIKKRDNKMYIKRENEMIFRLKCEMIYKYIYRINMIKCDNFNVDEYVKKLKKLNYDYEKKYGTDLDNYSGYNGKILHRINFIYSNDFDEEIEEFISKDAYHYLKTHRTGQNILIIKDKMYVPTVRNLADSYDLKKYIRTLDMIFKILNC